MTAAKVEAPLVHWDTHRRVCLEVARSKDSVSFVAMAVGEPFRVSSIRAASFDAAYKPVPNYPASRAAELLARYAVETGATKDVMTALGRFTEVSLAMVELATASDTARAEARAAGTGGFAAKPKADGTMGGETMSAMFQRLILAGGKTDEAIFAEVAKVYGLGPEKLRYVASYRCTMKKKGLNPPERKKA